MCVDNWYQTPESERRVEKGGIDLEADPRRGTTRDRHPRQLLLEQVQHRRDQPVALSALLVTLRVQRLQPLCAPHAHHESSQQ
jgi:hypothetical protein